MRVKFLFNILPLILKEDGKSENGSEEVHVLALGRVGTVWKLHRKS